MADLRERLKMIETGYLSPPMHKDTARDAIACIDELSAANARIAKLEAALKDTLNMLRAAHMQLGMNHGGNKRVIKARAALPTSGERA